MVDRADHLVERDDLQPGQPDDLAQPVGVGERRRARPRWPRGQPGRQRLGEQARVALRLAAPHRRDDDGRGRRPQHGHRVGHVLQQLHRHGGGERPGRRVDGVADQERGLGHQARRPRRRRPGRRRRRSTRAPRSVAYRANSPGPQPRSSSAPVPARSSTAACSGAAHPGPATPRAPASCGLTSTRPPATSTISRSFAHCSSAVSALPSTVEEKPHCGDRHSCSSGTYFAASSMRRLSVSASSSSPGLGGDEPEHHLLAGRHEPQGRERRRSARRRTRRRSRRRRARRRAPRRRSRSRPPPPRTSGSCRGTCAW